MIVRDKNATIQKANDIASILMKRMQKEARTFDCDDDPAEQVYLAVHTMGNLMYRICSVLGGYGKTYGIETLTPMIVHDWIVAIFKEHLNQNLREIE